MVKWEVLILAGTLIVLAFSVVYTGYLEERKQKTVILLDIFERFAGSDIRESRGAINVVYCNLTKNSDDTPIIFSQSNEIRSHANRVIASLNQVGQLFKNNVIDEETKSMIFQQHGRMIIRQWEIYQDDIEYQQNTLGIKERGEFFKYLKEESIKRFTSEYSKGELMPICTRN